MKKFLTFFGLTLFMLSLITMTACGDDKDEKEDEPNIEVPTNGLIGTWLWDDGVEPQLYTFYKNGKFEQKVWSPGKPDAYSIDHGTYRYDEQNGLLQLFWDYQSPDIWIIEIKGDMMYMKYADPYYNGTNILYRQK